MKHRQKLAKINSKRQSRLPSGCFGPICMDVVLWKPIPSGTFKPAKEITGLLRAFGITRYEIYGCNRPLKFNGHYLFKGRHINFWHRNVDHYALFKRAHQNFRSLMKELRPNIETSREAIDLIDKWTWLKKLYKQHGID